MSSLKMMVKNEDEVGIIASIYVASLTYCFNRAKHHKSKMPIIYIHRVEEALSLIDDNHRQIITNDFINHDDQWWKSVYSARVYLQLRQKAVSAFLMHFYES